MPWAGRSDKPKPKYPSMFASIDCNERPRWPQHAAIGMATEASVRHSTHLQERQLDQPPGVLPGRSPQLRWAATAVHISAVVVLHHQLDIVHSSAAPSVRQILRPRRNQDSAMAGTRFRSLAIAAPMSGTRWQARNGRTCNGGAFAAVGATPVQSGTRTCRTAASPACRGSDTRRPSQCTTAPRGGQHRGRLRCQPHSCSNCPVCRSAAQHHATVSQLRGSGMLNRTAAASHSMADLHKC